MLILLNRRIYTLIDLTNNSSIGSLIDLIKLKYFLYFLEIQHILVEYDILISEDVLKLLRAND